LDDSAYPIDGENFANAFAREPACQGLSLRRWTGSSNEQIAEALHSKHWSMDYSCNANCGGSADVEGKSYADFSGVDDAEAVKNACFVLKEGR